MSRTCCSLGRRHAFEEVAARHQDAGGAEAALQRVMAFEGCLQVAQLRTRAMVQAFDGVDAAAVGLHRQLHAGALGDAVDAYGAGAADAVLTADVGAGGAQLMAQEVRQQHARFGRRAARHAIERDGHRILDVFS